MFSETTSIIQSGAPVQPLSVKISLLQITNTSGCTIVFSSLKRRTSNGEVYAILSVDPTASVRDALSNPTFNLNTNIFDKRLNKIPHFDYVYQYISNNNLYDVIVEFALFNKDVGIKKDKLIVYELRTNY